jgi:ribonuclease E
MKVTFNTDDLSAAEAAAIQTLLDAVLAPSPAGPADEEEPSAPVIQMADRKAEQAAAEAAPAKKAAAAPEKPAKPAKAAKAPKAAKKPSEDAESASEEPTLDTAIDRAQALVAEGKGKALKAALETVGADKVRNLTEEQVPEFLAALEGA